MLRQLVHADALLPLHVTPWDWGPECALMLGNLARQVLPCYLLQQMGFESVSTEVRAR